MALPEAPKLFFFVFQLVYDSLFNTEFTTTALLLGIVKQKENFPC